MDLKVQTKVEDYFGSNYVELVTNSAVDSLCCGTHCILCAETSITGD